MGYKLTWMYIWQTKIRPTWWQPWANTVWYRPLTSVTEWTDQSWNGYDLSGSYRTFGTYGWVDCVYVSGWSNSDARLYNSSIPIGTNRTASIWFYSTTSNIAQWVICTWHDYINSIIWSWIYSSNLPYVTDWKTHDELWTWNILNAWHLMTVTYDGTTAILYIDGTENTRYNYTRTSDTAIAFSHKTYYDWGSQYSERFEWYLSEAIYEDKTWTQQEVSDYFDLTKSAYWVS